MGLSRTQTHITTVLPLPIPPKTQQKILILKTGISTQKNPSSQQLHRTQILKQEPISQRSRHPNQRKAHRTHGHSTQPVKPQHREHLWAINLTGSIQNHTHTINHPKIMVHSRNINIYQPKIQYNSNKSQEITLRISLEILLKSPWISTGNSFWILRNHH